MNKIVVHFADGRILKGFTADFLPTKDRFHVTETGANPGGRPLEVQVKDLKAIFFVRDFTGRPGHQERSDFETERAGTGRKIRVVFADGEVLLGTTQGYQPGRPGFFLVPADPDSNNERCYVVMAATREVGFV